MVTPKQERNIEKLMRRIKDAKDENMSKQEIKSRTNDLYSYLVNQGIVDP